MSETDKQMAEKLENAGKKAEKQKAERRERTVKGSHLQTAFVTLAKETGLTYVEKSGFAQVQGKRKNHKVYIALKGGRVDFSGFSVQHEAVTQISEEEAKTQHLGRVRGSIDFDKSDEQVMEAFKAGLAELLVEPPPELKKAPAAKKEETKVETTTEQPAATSEQGSTTEAPEAAEQ